MSSRRNKPEQAEEISGEETEPKVKRSGFDSFRENIEAIVVAVILAVFVRHFAVEAFEIPTGSMAPTLFGMHVQVESPNTGHTFEVGVPSNSSSGRLRITLQNYAVCAEECPAEGCGLKLHARAPGGALFGRTTAGLPARVRVECQSCSNQWETSRNSFKITMATLRLMRCPLTGHLWEHVIENSARGGGNKILVNKFAYDLGEPRRWDVIVFAFDQWKNYIKRLVGLPGEKINLINGDVYVNGKIERKPEHPYIQDILWKKISDSSVVEGGLSPVRAWKEPGGKGVPAWQELADGRWSLNSSKSPEPAVLEYQRALDNYIPYNSLAGRPRGRHSVGDVKLSFTATPTTAGGWIGAEIRDGDWTFQLRLPTGKPVAGRPAVVERVVNEPRADVKNPRKLRHPGAPVFQEREGISLKLNTRSRIELVNCDDCLVVRLNSEEIFSLKEAEGYISVPDVDNPPPESDHSQYYLRLLGSRVDANVEAIELHQDNYYTNDGAGHSHSIQLEQDRFFALGDNSPSSSDGRVWGSVPANNMLGKALLVFWPGLPGNFQLRFIR